MPRKPKLADGENTVITKNNYRKVMRDFEESVLRTWKSSTMIVPKMCLEFRVHFQEVYASTTGRIWAFTPFWRGRVFTDGIMMHEFLHWAIYPVDLFSGIGDIFRARRLLAEEVKFEPDIKETSLYGEMEDWSKFKYQVKEFAFIQNVLGDYLINLHIHDNHPELFKELWKFLHKDGTFYEQQKQIKRDTTFLLYLSVYSELEPALDEVPLQDPKSVKDKEKIAQIVREVRKGRMSKVYALKELVKIFHPYLEADAQAQKEGEGEGSGQEGEPKCPQCGHDEFEVVGYEDPQTGKWVKV